MFEQVLDYGITSQTLTLPLDAVFLLCIEMAQWINKDPQHVVVMHESAIEQFVTSCLMSVLYKEIFTAAAASKYVVRMQDRKLKLDRSMERYLGYFD